MTPVKKIRFLHSIRDKRLAKPLESVYRMENVSRHIPETIHDIDHENIGYHRQCYQKFTGHLHRLKDTGDRNPEPSTSQRHHSECSVMANSVRF